MKHNNLITNRFTQVSCFINTHQMKHEAGRSQKVRSTPKKRKSKEGNEMTDQEFLEILEQLWSDVGEERSD